MSGPILICECGAAYLPYRGMAAEGCPRCYALGRRDPVEGRPHKAFIDAYTERRRAQYRKSKLKSRLRKLGVAV